MDATMSYIVVLVAVASLFSPIIAYILDKSAEDHDTVGESIDDSFYAFVPSGDRIYLVCVDRIGGTLKVIDVPLEGHAFDA